MVQCTGVNVCLLVFPIDSLSNLDNESTMTGRYLRWIGYRPSRTSMSAFLEDPEDYDHSMATYIEVLLFSPHFISGSDVQSQKSLININSC